MTLDWQWEPLPVGEYRIQLLYHNRHFIAHMQAAQLNQKDKLAADKKAERLTLDQLVCLRSQQVALTVAPRTVSLPTDHRKILDQHVREFDESQEMSLFFKGYVAGRMPSSL